VIYDLILIKIKAKIQGGMGCILSVRIANEIGY
jgi:hypothetical protein